MKKYETPEMELLTFSASDVTVMSGNPEESQKQFGDMFWTSDISVPNKGTLDS